MRRARQRRPALAGAAVAGCASFRGRDESAAAQSVRSHASAEKEGTITMRCSSVKEEKRRSTVHDEAADSIWTT